MERTILHCDMNNFFAAVECVKNPTLLGRPMAVCGSVENRHGIVLAKNIPAKEFGVTTGEPIFRAKAKCPQLITVEPDYPAYLRISEAAQRIYGEYTDLIEPFGIDECWLDVTGSRRLFGSGEEIAEILRRRIREELGVTISVGVSFNKVFAKLGSDMKKPDAVTVIPRECFREIVWKRPVSELLGVGEATCARLRDCGIFTIGNLANAYPPMLRGKLGVNGLKLQEAAAGRDESPVARGDAVTEAKSVSRGCTPFRDLVTEEDVRVMVFALAEEIGHVLLAYRQRAGGVGLLVRDRNLNHYQYQRRLQMPTDSASLIAKEALSLFAEKHSFRIPLRSVTVSAIGLCRADQPRQLSFFSDDAPLERAERIDRVMNGINARFGKHRIRYGRLFGSDLSGNREVFGFSALTKDGPGA